MYAFSSRFCYFLSPYVFGKIIALLKTKICFYITSHTRYFLFLYTARSSKRERRYCCYLRYISLYNDEINFLFRFQPTANPPASFFQPVKKDTARSQPETLTQNISVTLSQLYQINVKRLSRYEQRSLKLDSHLPKKIFFIRFSESPLKMMKNTFYFIIKALFILKIFKFLSCHFVHVKKTSLIRKIRLILTFLTSQTGQQTIAIHMLPNISRCKGDQTLKFGHITEYNNRNIFL